MGALTMIVVLGAFLIALAGAAGYASGSTRESNRDRRMGFGAALIAIFMLFVLGLVWPSPYTVLALAALPAALLCLLGLTRPRIAAIGWLRWYVLLAVCLSPLAYLVQLVWLVRVL